MSVMASPKPMVPNFDRGSNVSVGHQTHLGPRMNRRNGLMVSFDVAGFGLGGQPNREGHAADPRHVDIAGNVALVAPLHHRGAGKTFSNHERIRRKGDRKGARAAWDNVGNGSLTVSRREDPCDVGRERRAKRTPVVTLQPLEIAPLVSLLSTPQGGTWDSPTMRWGFAGLGMWVLACADPSPSEATDTETTQPDVTSSDGETTTTDVQTQTTQGVDDSTSAETEEIEEVPLGDVQFSLDLDAPGTPTGELIGWNIGRGTLYGPADDPLHPQWRTPARRAAFEQLAAARGPEEVAPLVRFSGLQIDGALGGDGYHFWRYADPEHEVADDDNMAPFQYMAIIEEMGAEPLVTLNFGSGTAAEAADYVTHLVGTDMTDPLVAARAHWGRDEPYRPAAYELGNEIYAFWNTGYSATTEFGYANPNAAHGGDPPWHGRPAASAADYAARALEYVEAVRAVDPPAEFWIPISQASMDAWDGPEAAVTALAPLLAHEAVTSVVVHHYQVDDASTLGYRDMESLEVSLAGSEVFRPRYEELREALSSIERDAPLQIVVTEYHAAGAFTLGAYDEVADTQRVGLSVADMLITFAQLGIEQAAQHMAIAFGGSDTRELLFETWYNPLRADRRGGVHARSSWVATSLFASHLYAQTLMLEPIEVPQESYTGNSATFSYPIVHGVAFRHTDGDTASIVLLNRDVGSPVELSIDLSPGWSVETAQVYAPEDLTTLVGEDSLQTESLEVVSGPTRLRMVLPRHSMSAVRITRD